MGRMRIGLDKFENTEFVFWNATGMLLEFIFQFSLKKKTFI